MASLYARRDGGDENGLMQFFTKGANAINAPFNSSVSSVSIDNVLKVKPQATAPVNPAEGTIYINTTDNSIRCFLGGKWVQLNNE